MTQWAKNLKSNDIKNNKLKKTGQWTEVQNTISCFLPYYIH